jgi:pimeloyl-ACP methyl ester carboxylesterase
MYENVLKVNGVDIAYQRHGQESDPILLLLHGLSSPLSGWPSEMIEQFVAAGFQVLLLDNRDIGKSQKLDHFPIPNTLWIFLRFKLGLTLKVPYQLEDMMEDVIALLDALKLPKVHVVGASMGGMIAQLMAIHHPQRVSTLTSIMSTTGNKKLPTISKHVQKSLAQKPASSSYEDRKTYHIKKWRVIGSPNYPASDSYLDEYTEGLLQRGITASGSLRQMLAILVAANREAELAKVQIPTLVIHGDSDGLLHVEGGKATAKAIPNAKLKIYPGMGHDFPIELIPNISQDIISHVTSKESF